MSDTFDRRTDIFPAFDCILQLGTHRGHPQGGQSHGRGGIRIRHLLYSPDLSVQLLWYPGVNLPESEAALREKGWIDPVGYYPLAVDLGFHSPRPMSWAQEMASCDVYEDGCWYDGSGLNAEPVLELLIREGLDEVWTELETYHATLLDEFRSESTQ